MRRTPAAELVIVDNCATAFSECSERENVVMGYARTAVENH
jgi:hypothetical protein